MCIKIKIGVEVGHSIEYLRPALEKVTKNKNLNKLKQCSKLMISLKLLLKQSWTGQQV